MILVVGATGLLGSEICRRLAQSGQPVRALARVGPSNDKAQALQKAGVEVVMGDLKEIASLSSACENVSTVISTASSTLSRRDGDSIETVDRFGQLNLITVAKNAGIRNFVYVSIPRSLHYACPLSAAKREVELRLASSGLNYTVLLANYFMEVWLSPALGFEYANARARVYGDGTRPMAWISYHDVAGFAVDCVTNTNVRNKMLPIGGPENLAPLQVIRTFEEISGKSFTIEHVPESVLLEQYNAANDPLAKSFAALMLEYAQGCPMEMEETLRIMPRQLKTVREYAATTRGKS